MVGMKGGLLDGKNSRETFRDRKRQQVTADNAQEQKHQMENADAEKRDAFDADMKGDERKDIKDLCRILQQTWKNF